MKIFSGISQLGKLAISRFSHYDKSSQWKPELGSLYDIKGVNDLDGKPYDLSKLKGTVSLVCNVASECGLTKCGYQFLVEEQTKYASRDFTILAFPCNQFMSQEPGDAKDIRDFAVNNFHATFPLFTKADVNGPNTQPVVTYLKAVYPGDVTWNFEGMFLINEDGIPIGRFQTQKYPVVDAAIKQALDDRDERNKTAAATHIETPAATEPAAATNATSTTTTSTS